MGASFRNIGQIRALAGCDLLTISPDLLNELSQSTDQLARVLDPQEAKKHAPEWLARNEVAFRTELNQDAMATENMAAGIRVFVAAGIRRAKIGRTPCRERGGK